MIALYILLGILLLIALLLFFPLRIHAKYDESLALEIRYFFIKLGFPRPPLTPEQEAKKAKKKAKKEQKKEKKKAKKAEKKKKKGIKDGHLLSDQKKKFDFKEIFKRHGVSGLLSILKDAAALFKKHFKKLRHTKISYLSVDLVIARGNAADTAIAYGKTCAEVYPAVAGLLSVCRHGDYEIAVTPDFNAPKSSAKAEIKLSIRLFHLVSLALGIAFGAIGLYLRFRRGKYEKKKQPDSHPEKTNQDRKNQSELKKAVQ